MKVQSVENIKIQNVENINEVVDEQYATPTGVRSRTSGQLLTVGNKTVGDTYIHHSCIARNRKNIGI